jgi:hypothetical protein
VVESRIRAAMRRALSLRIITSNPAEGVGLSPSADDAWAPDLDEVNLPEGAVGEDEVWTQEELQTSLLPTSLALDRLPVDAEARSPAPAGRRRPPDSSRRARGRRQGARLAGQRFHSAQEAPSSRRRMREAAWPTIRHVAGTPDPGPRPSR